MPNAGVNEGSRRKGEKESFDLASNGKTGGRGENKKITGQMCQGCALGP